MKKGDETEIKLVKRKKPVKHYHEEYDGGGSKPKKSTRTIKRNPSGKPTNRKPVNTKPVKPKKKIVQWEVNPPEPKHMKVRHVKGNKPEVKKIDMPDKINPSKGRKRVRRPITTRDGSGVGAKKGQSLGNKIQRAKDKVKRAVKPWIGKEQYYNDKQEISKKTYKALKKASK